MTARPCPILVTHGWCRVSYVSVHSLAAAGHPVHVVDASGLAMCRHSGATASFTRVPGPWSDPDGYVSAVADACYRNHVRVLLPGHDDLLLFARNRDRLPEHTLLAAGTPEQIEMLADKESLLGPASDAAVPVPETGRPAHRDEVPAMAAALGFPLVVKPRVGNSAKGVTVVRDERACLRAFDRTVRQHGLGPGRLPLLQQHVPGQGHGVALLYDRGRCVAAFAERYLRCKNGDLGTSVLRESVEAPVLVAAARRLLDHVQWHGLAQLDFLHDPSTGHFALLEVNPRLWGALDLAVRSGVDFPVLYARLALGEAIEPVLTWRSGVRSRWILGEAMHLVNHVRHLRPLAFLRSAMDMARVPADGNDDRRPGEWRPLVDEALYYGSRLLAGGSLNPVEEGMVR